MQIPKFPSLPLLGFSSTSVLLPVFNNIENMRILKYINCKFELSRLDQVSYYCPVQQAFRAMQARLTVKLEYKLTS